MKLVAGRSLHRQLLLWLLLPQIVLWGVAAFGAYRLATRHADELTDASLLQAARALARQIRPTASGLFRTLGGGDIDLTGLTADTGGKLNVTLFAVEALQLGAAYNLTLLNAEGAGKMLYRDGAFNADHFHVTASGFTFDSSGYVLTGTPDVLTVSFVPVPEPATVFAVGAAGLGALGLARRLRRRKAGAVAG